MTVVSSRQYTAQEVSYELTDVLTKYSENKTLGEKTIVTNRGRTFIVATVCESTQDNWTVINEVSKGMFRCDDCYPKFKNGDTWYQIKRDEEVVRVHDNLIHKFEKHPEKVNGASVQKVGKVLLG